MHAVITGDVWIGPEHRVETGRTTAPGRAALAGSPAMLLTVAEEEALEEAVDRAMEGAALTAGPLATGPSRRAEAADAGPAPEARGRWEAAVAVVRGWLGAGGRNRAMDVHLEERRDAVRRELLLRDPRLW